MLGGFGLCLACIWIGCGAAWGGFGFLGLVSQVDGFLVALFEWSFGWRSGWLWGWGLVWSVYCFELSLRYLGIFRFCAIMGVIF